MPTDLKRWSTAENHVMRMKIFVLIQRNCPFSFVFISIIFYLELEPKPDFIFLGSEEFFLGTCALMI